MKSATILEALHFEPLTKDNWSAFELLFGTKGACGGVLVHVVSVAEQRMGSRKIQWREQAENEIAR